MCGEYLKHCYGHGTAIGADISTSHVDMSFCVGCLVVALREDNRVGDGNQLKVFRDRRIVGPRMNSVQPICFLWDQR